MKQISVTIWYNGSDERGELPHSQHTLGVAVTSDGTVYIGGDGLLYRWTEQHTKVGLVGTPIEGETYFWRLVVGADGCVRVALIRAAGL